MIRNIIAVVVGFIVGSAVNIAIVSIGPMVIPLPPGSDTTTTEGLIAAIPFFEAKHFIAPFLAHALGTLVGATVAATISVTHKMVVAMIVGCLTMVGGIVAVLMFPAPLWFEAVDLIFAYIPMAWIGGKLGGMRSGS